MQPIANPFQANPIAITVPIWKRVNKNIHPTNLQLTLMTTPPNNETYDYAIEVSQNKSVFRLYIKDTWVRSYCRKCNKYYANDNSCINAHCLRNHDNSQKEWFTKVKKLSLKLYLLNASFANLVEKRDFIESFGDSICSKTITSYMHTIYSQEQEMIKGILEQEPFLTIYFDEWTKFGINFIGISVSTKSSVYALDVIAPDDMNRSRETVRNILCTKLQWFNIMNKIAFHCTDCASNVIALLESKWFPCTNHVLNRCIEDMLSELERAMKIVNMILPLRKSACLRQFLFLNKAPRTVIPKYTRTRWYSLANFFSTLKMIFPYLTMYQNNRRKEGKSDLKKGIPFLSFTDRCVIEDCEEFFTQLMMIMKELESDNPETIFWALSNILTVYYDIAPLIANKGYVRAAEKLKLGILTRFAKYQKYDYLNILVTAAFLNPFLQWNLLIIPDEELPDELKGIKEKFFDFIRRTVPEAFSCINQSSQNGIRRRGTIVQDEMNEFQKFLNIPRLQGKEGIALWWESQKQQFPNLYQLVQRLLTLRSTSCSVERMFSKGRYVLGDYTGNMTKENMAQKVLLYCNQEITRTLINAFEE